MRPPTLIERFLDWVNEFAYEHRWYWLRGRVATYQVWKHDRERARGG